MSLRCLSRLALRALPKIFALAQGSPMASQADGHLEPAPVGTESADLPVEILMDILALLEIPDLVRAGSVCSSWHAAYNGLRQSGIYGRPQTPCLLYTSESDGDRVACLYSLAERRVYRLALPGSPIRTRYLIGSSNGWLVTADERSELHMVNPITGEQIALPSVTTIEQVKPVVDDDAGSVQEYEFSQYYGEEEIADPSIHALDELRDWLYVKAFVFSTAPLGSYIVVLIHNPIGQLSFAKAGDRSWTWLPPGACYEDCIYMDGMLYAVTTSGGIEAFDLTGPVVSRKVITDRTKDYNYEHMYIVQAPSGDLLQVWREQDAAVENAEDVGATPQRQPSELFSETRKIMVYKIDMAAKELVEVDGLHDHVLFLGLSQSHCWRAQEYPQLKGNHVYLTDDDQGFALWKSRRRDIAVFNLENCSKEEVVSPQLWRSWPAPIWITLSLTKLSSGSNSI